jgi:hypothetical protein
MKNLNNPYRDIFIFLLVGALGILIFNQYSFRYRDTFPRLIELSQGIPAGVSPWLAFQNRLLGPWIVNGLSFVLGSPMRGILFFYLVALCTQSYCIYFLLNNLTSSKNIAIKGTLVFSLLLLGYQDPNFYYPWDPIEGIIFSIFSYLALRKNPSLLILLLLFIIASLNRESSLYIAFFIFLLGFNFSKNFPYIKLHSYWHMLIGSSALLAGIVYTKSIRTFLFKSQPDGTLDITNQAIGNHFHLGANLKALLYTNFSGNLNGTMTAANSIWIIGSIIFIVWLVARAKTDFSILVRILLIYLVMVSSILMFGLINETRIFFPLFIVFIFMYCRFFLCNHESHDAH